MTEPDSEVEISTPGNAQPTTMQQLAAPPSIRWWIAGFAIPALLVLVWCLLIQQFSEQASSWSALSAMSLVALVACIMAAVTDLRWRRIFNWITYPAALWCLALGAIGNWTEFGSRLNLSAVPFSDSVTGFFAILFLLLIIFSISGGGAGDVKLAAVLGAGLGLAGGLKALAFTFIVAGVGGFCWMVYINGPLTLLKFFVNTIGGFLLPMWIRKPTPEEREQLKLMLPLGPYFAIGCGMVIFNEALGGWLAEI